MVAFGKVEVYIGYSSEVLERVREALTYADITYSWKEVNHSGNSGGSLSDLPGGAPMDNVKLYTVSVSQADGPKARKVVGQVLQRLGHPGAHGAV